MGSDVQIFLEGCWERKSTVGRSADFCRVPEKFLLSVWTKSITENFVH